MNDKHEKRPEYDTQSGDPIEELAALDPADAPGAAERYASDLAAELEESGGAASDPVQLRADLGDSQQT